MILRKFRTKLMASLLALGIFFNLASIACGIRRPMAPSWLSSWQIPLINRSISIQEIIDRLDHSSVVFDSVGNPRIEISEALDTVFADQDLSLDNNELDITDSIGVIEIDPPAPAQTTTYLNQILPIDIGFVPPSPFDFNQPVQRFSSFTWAEIESGVMAITFTNRLEIDLDTLIVTVIDSTDLHLIGVLNYDHGVAYMETETQSLDISGQTVSNAVFMTYHGHTPGGILINAGDQYLRADIFFPDTVMVSSALAEVPEIVRNTEGIYEIDDSTKIYASTIASGNINLDIHNDTALPFEVTLSSPNFKQGGTDFRVTRLLNSNTVSHVSLNISGYDFIPDDGLPNQSVRVAMTSVVIPSAPNQYLFRAEDSLKTHISISEIHFQSIDGRIAPINVNFEPAYRTLDFPEGFNHANLYHGCLNLAIANSSMIPASLHVLIQGGGKTVNMSGMIAPKISPDAPPAVTVLAAGPEQSRYFLCPPPSEIIVSGWGTINPDYEVVSLRAGDSFTGEAVISSPFEFSFSDTAVILPRIVAITFGDTRPENFGDRLNSGAISAALINHLPLGARVTLYLGVRGDSSLYLDPASIKLGPYELPSAETDSLGFVVSAVHLTIADSIAGDMLTIFNNDSLFFGERIELMPTDSSGVVITGNDYLRMGASARLQVRIGND